MYNVLHIIQHILLNQHTARQLKTTRYKYVLRTRTLIHYNKLLNSDLRVEGGIA